MAFLSIVFLWFVTCSLPDPPSDPFFVFQVPNSLGNVKTIPHSRICYFINFSPQLSGDPLEIYLRPSWGSRPPGWEPLIYCTQTHFITLFWLWQLEKRILKPIFNANQLVSSIFEKSSLIFLCSNMFFLFLLVSSTNLNTLI